MATATSLRQSLDKAYPRKSGREKDGENKTKGAGSLRWASISLFGDF